MDLKKLFTTRKFGLTLDEFLAISVACTFATFVEDFLFPVQSGWARLGIFSAGWFVGFFIYTIIKALVIMQYEKKYPADIKKEPYEEIFNEFENKKE